MDKQSKHHTDGKIHINTRKSDFGLDWMGLYVTTILGFGVIAGAYLAFNGGEF